MISPEQDFIKELKSYFGESMKNSNENAVIGMLLRYKRSCEQPKEVVQYIPKIQVVFVDKTTNERLILAPDQTKVIKPETVINAVCTHFGVSKKVLFSRDKYWETARARKICMHFIYIYCGLNLCEIGRLFKRDHTTVISNKRSVLHLSYTDVNFKAEVDALDSYFGGILFDQKEESQKIV